MTTESSEQSGAAVEAKHDETVTESRALFNAPHEPEYCHPREKQLICKVDWRLLPILGALYAIALVDRVNVCGFHWHRLPSPLLTNPDLECLCGRNWEGLAFGSWFSVHYSTRGVLHPMLPF
jgi:hypothetical protein